MVKAMDNIEICTDDNSDQPMIPITPNGSQISPLDLSINSKQCPFRPGASSPIDLSVRPNQIVSPPTINDNYYYDTPQVIIEPKREWHYRSIKDLAKNHLPYVAGNGPQRTPIRVTVPSSVHQQLYLVTAILTVDDDFHPSKVIVPAKTYVNAEHISHDNNLDCLKFDKCSLTDIFDADTRCIHSEISQSEHHVGYKDVRIHMFNLYQNQYITKEMILNQQLNLCKLAFWLCVRRDKKFVRVSDVSFSTTIEEKKMNSRSRTTTSVNQPTMIPTEYSAFCIDYNNNNEDDSMETDDSL